MMNKLYIGNLSPAVTADDLRQLFGDRKLPLAGQVLLKSGYAFVDYPDQNWAIRAIETLSGSPLPQIRRVLLLLPRRTFSFPLPRAWDLSSSGVSRAALSFRASSPPCPPAPTFGTPSVPP
ncbi:hypothetical protein P7K49_030121 [Saguinus oedipus]|uniref:RRM domain-containing protein n=1 Tax=Saguinus oedipus TaxID=9490 RepID=A0ABQ9U1C5_SAGOE|nr:hypothetical protein P7K49_030121 [Saguinus oedipus]